jgi:hypothetical protein
MLPLKGSSKGMEWLWASARTWEINKLDLELQAGVTSTCRRKLLKAAPESWSRCDYFLLKTRDRGQTQHPRPWSIHVWHRKGPSNDRICIGFFFLFDLPQVDCIFPALYREIRTRVRVHFKFPNIPYHWLSISSRPFNHSRTLWCYPLWKACRSNYLAFDLSPAIENLIWEFCLATHCYNRIQFTTPQKQWVFTPIPSRSKS